VISMGGAKSTGNTAHFRDVGSVSRIPVQWPISVIHFGGSENKRLENAPGAVSTTSKRNRRIGAA
jgi:hypothetical protein